MNGTGRRKPTMSTATSKRLRRYVSEATFRLNERNVKVHTLTQLEAFVVLTLRFRLSYERFITE